MPSDDDRFSTIKRVSDRSLQVYWFIGYLLFGFYRAMHFSAKRGIAISCRLSVCLSVTLVDQDHMGWKSWKLTARTISPTPSFFVAQRPATYSQGNMGKFGGD